MLHFFARKFFGMVILGVFAPCSSMLSDTKFRARTTAMYCQERCASEESCLPGYHGGSTKAFSGSPLPGQERRPFRTSASRAFRAQSGRNATSQAGRSGPKVAETLLREQCILGPKPGCARGETSPVPPLNAGNLRAVLPNLGGLVA